MKNGPRVWAFCKIEFPGIQKPVQILAQKSGFFRNSGNRGVGVIWLVLGLILVGLVFFVLSCLLLCCCGFVWVRFTGCLLFALIVFCFGLAVQCLQVLER